MSGSVIAIKKNGVDISDHVLYPRTRFQSLANAVPGQFDLACKDLDQDLTFVTGDEITLDVDGQRLFGGYVMQVGRTHAFPADEIATVSSYDNRIWEVSGVDYNVLFDKRVIRNTSNYLTNDFAIFTGTGYDGDLLTTLLTNYADIPGGFDVSTYMDNVAQPAQGAAEGSYRQQGTKLREQFEQFALWSGAVWYIDPNKNFHWHALEDVESRWGFSDQPNNAAITTSPNEFQDAYYGFREVEATEDGSVIINDALIWGGSQWAGSGGTVFAREQNATSISTHGRWQTAEVRFGESGFGIQEGVDARADAIVNGPPGADQLGQLKGLRYPQWQFRFAWFAHDVPTISSVRDHLTVGDLVHIDMQVFGITKILPLRSLSITFPGLDPEGKAYVRFEGEFSLNVTDPFTLWKYLLSRSATRVTTTIVATVSGSSGSTVYGAQFQGIPTPAPNGSETVFSIPFGYIAGTSELYINGLIQIRNENYSESDPENGEFTLTFSPASDDEVYVIARTLST